MPRSHIETLIHAPTKRLNAWLRRWEMDIARALAKGVFTRADDGQGGIILFEDKRLRGEYFFAPEPGSKELCFHHNLLVDQGIMYDLGVALYTTAKIDNWYLGLFSGSTTPGATLTAANVASTLSEITSTTEGYTQTTRPAWTPSAPTSNVISNSASKAKFTIEATTSITATGGFLVSSNVRGGTSGTLWSAGKFDNARELFDGEDFELGYQTSLSD